MRSSRARSAIAALCSHPRVLAHATIRAVTTCATVVALVTGCNYRDIDRTDSHRCLINDTSMNWDYNSFVLNHYDSRMCPVLLQNEGDYAPFDAYVDDPNNEGYSGQVTVWNFYNEFIINVDADFFYDSQLGYQRMHPAFSYRAGTGGGHPDDGVLDIQLLEYNTLDAQAEINLTVCVSADGCGAS